MRRAVLFVTLTLSACGGSGPSGPSGPTALATLDDRAATTAALQAAWRTWQASGPRSYRYTLRRDCFCLERGPAVVTVRSGQVQSVVDATSGEPVPPERWEAYTTVDGLFLRLFEAVEQRAWAIRATYDERLGYPREAYVDRSPQMADEEFGFSAGDLEPQ